MKPDRQPTPAAAVQPAAIIDLSATPLTVGAPTFGPHDRPCPHCAGLGSLPIDVSNGLLLASIAHVEADRWFTCRDLFAAPELKDVLAGLTVDALGCRLRKIARGPPIDGFLVESGGREHGKRLWRVVEG